jgi:uncharacterized protein (TIGR02118 family)
MFVVTVLYPAKAKFDYAYYQNKHMKLVADRWGDMGLVEERVVKVAAAAAGEPQHQVITQLKFSSQERFNAALAAHGAEIMGDIANFTDGSPVVEFGTQLG